MNSLAHNRTRFIFKASRRSVSPFHPDIFFLSLPRSASAIDSSLHSGPLPSPPVLTTPANFYTPQLAPFNSHKSRVRRARRLPSVGFFERDARQLCDRNPLCSGAPIQP